LEKAIDIKLKDSIIRDNIIIVNERNEYVCSDRYSEPMAVEVRPRSAYRMDSGDAA
jgi:hypothetical protein